MQFNPDFLILLKTLDNQKRKDYSINDNGTIGGNLNFRRVENKRIKFPFSYYT